MFHSSAPLRHGKSVVFFRILKYTVSNQVCIPPPYTTVAVFLDTGLTSAVANFPEIDNAAWRHMANLLNWPLVRETEDKPFVANNTIPTFMPFSQCQ